MLQGFKTKEKLLGKQGVVTVVATRKEGAMISKEFMGRAFYSWKRDPKGVSQEPVFVLTCMYKRMRS